MNRQGWGPQDSFLLLPGLWKTSFFQFWHSFMYQRAFKLDFFQLPLSMGYQYALVVGCIFSGRVDAFPCHKAKAIAFTVTEKMFPIWGIPQGYLHSHHMPRDGGLGLVIAFPPSL